MFSVRTDLSIFGTSWRRFGLITQTALLLFAFVAAADLSSGVDRVRAYLRASTVATILVALYGILQYLGWDPWLDPKIYHVGTGVWTIVRPPGTLGYVTYFANYLVFGAFQGLALARIETRIFWHRAGAPAAMALASVAIVLTGTRAAWLAMIAGGVVLWALEGRRPAARTLWIAAVVAVIGNRVLRLTRGLATARPDAVVSRGPGRRSAPLSVARLTRSGWGPLAEGVGAGDLFRRISAGAIAGPVAGVPGVLPRVRAQHFSGRGDGARDCRGC